MAENKRILYSLLGFALCLMMVSFSWPMMKFGGIIIRFNFDDTEWGSWITSAYIIAEVAMVPIAGKLIDHVGLKKCLILGVVVFDIASLLCTTVTCLRDLATFRFIQGIGAAFCFACAFTAPGRLLPHGERGTAHSLMSGAFALGSLFGSAVGFYLAIEIDWRYIFYLPALFVLLGGVMALKFLPAEECEKKKYDVPGFALMFVTLLLGMAYTQTVSKEFEMFSWESAAFLAFILLFSIALYHNEREAVNPVFPRSFRGFNRNLGIAILLMSIAIIGLLAFYVKIYLFCYAIPNGEGIDGGLYRGCSMFIFLLIGGAITSFPAGHKVHITGVRPWVILGCSMCCLGLLLTSLIVAKGIWCMAICLVVLGTGLGAMISALLISLQALTPREEMGAVSSFTMGMRIMAIATGLAFYQWYSTVFVDNVIHGFDPDFEWSGDLFELLIAVIFSFIDYIDTILDAMVTAFQNACAIGMVLSLIGVFIAYNMGTDDRGLCGPQPEKEKKRKFKLRR